MFFWITYLQGHSAEPETSMVRNECTQPDRATAEGKELHMCSFLTLVLRMFYFWPS